MGNFVSTRVKRSQLPQLRRKVGVVFPGLQAARSRNVFENIAISMRIRGARNFDIKRQVTHLLNQVGLYHKRHDSPTSLSGGEQQRVAIARAVVGGPSILLADEPTGNLDPEVTEEILRLLFRINSSGTAVLMATHNHEMVRNFGQRIVHLRDGQLHEDKRTGLVGNLGDRLDALQNERERLNRIEDEIARARQVAAAATAPGSAASRIAAGCRDTGETSRWRCRGMIRKGIFLVQEAFRTILRYKGVTTISVVIMSLSSAHAGGFPSCDGQSPSPGGYSPARHEGVRVSRGQRRSERYRIASPSDSRDGRVEGTTSFPRYRRWKTSGGNSSPTPTCSTRSKPTPCRTRSG